MRIQVSRVDLDGRRIDFRMIREGDDLTGRAPLGKGDGRNERKRSRETIGDEAEPVRRKSVTDKGGKRIRTNSSGSQSKKTPRKRR